MRRLLALLPAALADLVEETTTLSTAPLPAATFDVPMGYRRLAGG